MYNKVQIFYEWLVYVITRIRVRFGNNIFVLTVVKIARGEAEYDCYYCMYDYTQIGQECMWLPINRTVLLLIYKSIVDKWIVHNVIKIYNNKRSLGMVAMSVRGFNAFVLRPLLVMPKPSTHWASSVHVGISIHEVLEHLSPRRQFWTLFLFFFSVSGAL